MDCATCKKPAKLTCSGCKSSPVINGDPPHVHYCNTTCQKADWQRHKATCRRLMDRQKLYRVGRLTQEMFLIFRELTWCQLKVSAVAKQGNELIVHGRKMQSTTWPRDYFPFPSHVVPEAEDRKALLSFLSCRDAFFWEVEFADGLLGAMVKETSHVKHWTKKGKLNMRMVQPGIESQRSGVDIQHEIIKLTLRSGEKYAFDVSGFQYGYPSPITPWNVHERERVFEMISMDPAPKSEKLIRVDDFSFEYMVNYAKRMIATKQSRRNISEQIMEAVNFHVLEWQADSKVSIEELWDLRQDKFEVSMANLINFVDGKLNFEPDQPYSTVNGKQQALTLRRGSWIYGK